MGGVPGKKHEYLEHASPSLACGRPLRADTPNGPKSEPRIGLDNTSHGHKDVWLDWPVFRREAMQAHSSGFQNAPNLSEAGTVILHMFQNRV